MVQKALFQSDSNEWRTPNSLFQYLDSNYHFTLDAAASAVNHKCANYFDKSNSALTNDWSGRVWCNPPYSRDLAPLFIKRVIDQVKVQKNAELCWVLLPARTDTRLWHNYIFPFADEILFIKGRLKFLDENGYCQGSAPFPSALIRYSSEVTTRPLVLIGTLDAVPANNQVLPKYLL